MDAWRLTEAAAEFSANRLELLRITEVAHAGSLEAPVVGTNDERLTTALMDQPGQGAARIGLASSFEARSGSVSVLLQA
jgi:hypothetical protein